MLENNMNRFATEDLGILDDEFMNLIEAGMANK